MSTDHRDPRRTVVIGAGNVLMGDDGLGLAALERLRSNWTVPEEVDLVDGGTFGLYLLPAIEDAARLLVLDAIDIGAEPGTEIVLARKDLPRYVSRPTSPHQVSLCDALALAELRDALADDTTIIGLQPGLITFSTHLSDPVASRIDDLVALAVRVLADWGHQCTQVRS